MPGLTDNELAIDALNQAIVALNELVDGSPGDQSELIAAIADNIEAVRTEIETRSVAEVVAQNTNFFDLISAINAIQQCSPTVIKQAFDIELIQEFEPEQAIEFDPPPSNWTETFELPGSQPYFDRKCKAANQLVNGLHFIFEQWADVNFAVLLTVSIGLVSGALKAIFSSPIAGPFAIIIGVAGAIVQIIQLLVSGTFDFAKLRDISLSNHSDLVCDLYDSTTANGAISALIATYAANGATAEEQQLINLLMEQSGAANNLYFDRELTDVVNPDQTTITSPCESCAAECTPHVYWGNVDFTAGLQTWESEFRTIGGGPHYIIHFCYCPTEASPKLDVEFKSIDGWTHRGPQYWDFRLHSDCSPINVEGDVWLETTTPPTLDTPFCFNQLIFWSATPFTVDVDISGGC